MAKFKGSFFVETKRGLLDGLIEYHETIESQLRKASSTDWERKQETLRTTDLTTQDRWIEYDIASQEHAVTHNMLFANFARYSFVALVCLVMENLLREFCHLAGLRKGKSAIEVKGALRGRGGFLKRCQRFLSTVDATVEGDLWTSVYDLAKIRNCIAHVSGDVSQSKDRERLLQLADKHDDLCVSGPDHEWGYYDELAPLYYRDGMLVLETGFCKRAVGEVRRLFDALCNAISLRGIVVEGWDEAADKSGEP